MILTRFSASCNKIIITKCDYLLSFSSNYMNFLCMKFIDLYINYHTLSTPGDL